MDRPVSHDLFEKAKTIFPGGVNSPVRAFGSVGGTPVFIKKGEGARIWDEDDNEYIDFNASWGPLILGHAHPKVVEKIQKTVANGTSFGTPTRLENELGQLVLDHHKYVDQIRFVSSGTEAVMSGLRLARAYTGNTKVIKFEGCYHGHVDSLLVNAGSGLATLGTSSSAGVPEGFSHETIVVPLNDREAINEAVARYKNEIACIIIEPIPANNGLLPQGREFIQFLRDVCDNEGILLFFDEVISGFRVGFEGAAGLYDIQPDIITFGKILGGGLPLGAYAGSHEIMKEVSPLGPMYQAGTLSGNPACMAAGIATLTECLKPNFYSELEDKTNAFVQELNEFATDSDYPFSATHMGSIFWLNFSRNIAITSSDISQDGIGLFKTFYHQMLENGLYFGPSGYEVGFVSAAHTKQDLSDALEILKKGLAYCFAKSSV